MKAHVPRVVWSIFSPRLWMVCTVARTDSSFTPSSRSRKGDSAHKFARGHRQGVRLPCLGRHSWSTLRRRQACAQHQHFIVEHIARATPAVEEYITPAPEVYPALRQVCTQHQHSVVEFVAPAPEVHPALRLNSGEKGTVCNRDAHRGATSQKSQVEDTSCFVVSEFSCLLFLFLRRFAPARCASFTSP